MAAPAGPGVRGTARHRLRAALLPRVGLHAVRRFEGAGPGGGRPVPLARTGPAPPHVLAQGPETGLSSSHDRATVTTDAGRASAAASDRVTGRSSPSGTSSTRSAPGEYSRRESAAVGTRSSSTPEEHTTTTGSPAGPTPTQ